VRQIRPLKVAGVFTRIVVELGDATFLTLWRLPEKTTTPTVSFLDRRPWFAVLSSFLGTPNIYVHKSIHKKVTDVLKRKHLTMFFTQESFGLRAAIASCLVASVCAFQANPTFSRVGSALKVAVDPSTITNKEYEDICGVSFNEQSLQERLKSTKFLYPKHVEVIEEIGPLAGRMVDEIVSTTFYGNPRMLRDALLPSFLRNN
jgi:hypothetical protein